MSGKRESPASVVGRLTTPRLIAVTRPPRKQRMESGWHSIVRRMCSVHARVCRWREERHTAVYFRSSPGSHAADRFSECFNVTISPNPSSGLAVNQRYGIYQRSGVFHRGIPPGPPREYSSIRLRTLGVIKTGNVRNRIGDDPIRSDPVRSWENIRELSADVFE
jgi:hypothetical protein